MAERGTVEYLSSAVRVHIRLPYISICYRIYRPLSSTFVCHYPENELGLELGLG